ncbi:hypothetical protein B296_00048878 [Ensete ventricosum]|uniref:GDSL esterase/lipase n=1 Tax=Ensete ventricosum TaxID=4639 RepID=A0A426YPU1_ENSVE|nr:hypothetical protein B296_00048878 [Ensete ventricosum]
MACCGGEGPYHFNFSVGCGDPTSTWCGDPWSYVCWDGKHLTEAGYHVIAHAILDVDDRDTTTTFDVHAISILTAAKSLVAGLPAVKHIV